MHQSAGVIIKNKEGKILLINREKPPFGWACPAGHIEENEAPEIAAKRETEEEVGIKVIKLQLLLNEFVDWNECSRGVKGHDWYVFEVVDWQGEIRPEIKEVNGIEWASIEELKDLKLEPVWEYWFKKLRLI